MRVLVCALPLAIAAFAGSVSCQLDAALAMSSAGEVRIGETTYPYRLLEPPVAARSTPLPLVVFLHGAGERGSDNRRQLTWLPAVLAAPAARERHPCWLLAVQCPAAEQWVDVPWADPLSTPLPVQPSRAMQAVLAAMDGVLADPRVDGGRVYLTGLSMGGYGAWDLAVRCPERFAAVLAVCGGGDERRAANLLAMPVRAVHGADDPVVPVVRSRTMVAALRTLGAPVVYDELAGVQHDSWRQAYGPGGALDWLFAQDLRQQRRGPFAEPVLVPMPDAVRLDPAGSGHACATLPHVVGKGAAAGAATMLASVLADAAGDGANRRVVDAAVGVAEDMVVRIDQDSTDWCHVDVGAAVEVVGRDAVAVQAAAGLAAQLFTAWPRERVPAGRYAQRVPLRAGWVVVANASVWTPEQCLDLLRTSWRHGYRGIAGLDLAGMTAANATRVRDAAVGCGLSLLPEAPGDAIVLRGATDAVGWLVASCPGDGPFAVEIAPADTAVLTVRLALAAERAAHADTVLHANAVLARIAALLRR